MSRGNTWHFEEGELKVEGAIPAPTFDFMANPGEKAGDEPRIRVWTNSLADASTSGYQTYDLSDAKALVAVLSDGITAAESLT